MKTTSKKAYTKGQIEFWTHKNIITEAMKDGEKRTFREIARKVRLRDDQVWKRVSELETDGVLINVGTKDYEGRPNTLYQYNIEGVKPTKKQSFRDWCNVHHPEVVHKYDVLVKHEL